MQTQADTAQTSRTTVMKLIIKYRTIMILSCAYGGIYIAQTGIH